MKMSHKINDLNGVSGRYIILRIKIPQVRISRNLNEK